MTGDSTESENEIARFRCPKHQNPAIPKQPTKTNAILAQSFSRSSRTTRYDANDKPILSADSFYVIVKKDGRWGALVRSSYVGVIGKKTAF